MESCKEFVRRIVRSLTVESCKEFVRRIVRSLTEWRAVRSLLENCKESD